MLKRAKAMGDYLIVGVSTDDFNRLKNKRIFYSYEERKLVVESIRYVDLVIPENNWEQKSGDIEEHKIDTFVMGNDWEGKFDNLKSQCEVVYLPRTTGIGTIQTNTQWPESKKHDLFPENSEFESLRNFNQVFQSPNQKTNINSISEIS